MRHHHAVAPAAAAWSVATSSGGGSLAGGPEGTSRSVVGGCSSVAQATPQRQQVAAPLPIGAWQCLHTRGIWRLRIAQRSFDGPCAVVMGAATVAGSATTGLGGRESTMNLSPRSHARTLASGPGAGVGVSSIVTTFRLKALSSQRTKLS
jgi:hypothetical protein